MTDPAESLQAVHATLLAAREGATDPEPLLQALTALRALREEISAWEPELITAARTGGASWSALAPALGVASRQAAERRYLRLRPSSSGETTGEARVEAERGRRAGERAVADWARRNSATLRRLAGRVSSLEGLAPEARAHADRVGAALGDDDVTALLPHLASARPHLTGDHPGLAGELGSITEETDRLRRDTTVQRRGC